MITYLSMPVFGMENEINVIEMPLDNLNHVDKSKNSGLIFKFDKDILLIDEYKIICDSFNAMCNSNIKNMPKNILLYCAETINNKIKSKKSSIKDFDKSSKNFLSRDIPNLNSLIKYW